MNVPVLETDRLLLREWREESDFDEYARICADPDVMRYLGGKTFTRLEAWRHMALLVGHWHLRGFGHWAVEEKATARFIGRLGLFEPDTWPGFEIGWTLAKERWGNGFATEGALRALDYAFTEMGREHVISLIHPENRGSIGVAERVGETLEGETVVFGFPALVYGIGRETYLSSRS